MMSSNRNKRLLVMAGGTGGHVFPALAVAHILLAKGWVIHWLGTADRMEARLIPKTGIPINFIKISGLRGKGFFSLILAPFKIIKAIWQSIKIITKFKPDVVLGMGGYVSGPGGIAAKLCGVPLVIHEQNSVAGLTNRWLAKLAHYALQAFPGAIKNAQVVGNPLRSEVIDVLPPDQRFNNRAGPLRVLVMGGSQGAEILNTVMPEVYKQLNGRIIIWHQTGKGAKEKVLKAYGESDLSQSRLNEFIDNMAEAYEWADVVICRSGALTVSEVAAVGIPAIFVPFQHKDRQQYFNAKPLEDAGSAIIIDQIDFMPKRVSELLAVWNRPVLLTMATKAKQLGINDAAQHVAALIEQIVKSE